MLLKSQGMLTYRYFRSAATVLMDISDGIYAIEPRRHEPMRYAVTAALLYAAGRDEETARQALDRARWIHQNSLARHRIPEVILRQAEIAILVYGNRHERRRAVVLGEDLFESVLCSFGNTHPLRQSVADACIGNLRACGRPREARKLVDEARRAGLTTVDSGRHADLRRRWVRPYLPIWARVRDDRRLRLYNQQRELDWYLLFGPSTDAVAYSTWSDSARQEQSRLRHIRLDGILSEVILPPRTNPVLPLIRKLFTEDMQAAGLDPCPLEEFFGYDELAVFGEPALYEKTPGCGTDSRVAHRRQNSKNSRQGRKTGA